MPLLLAAAVLVALLACALATLVTRSRLAARLLLVASVVWPLVNGPLEGPLLWRLEPHHGVTASDLCSPIGVLLAVIVLRRQRSKSPMAAALTGRGTTSGPG